LFLAITLSSFQTTAPALADKVLYCVDTGAVGLLGTRAARRR
jgi:hypothetical protein